MVKRFKIKLAAPRKGVLIISTTQQRLCAKDRNFPDLVDDVKFSRYTKAMLRQDDETDERLAVREQVALAKLGNLPRSLE